MACGLSWRGARRLQVPPHVGGDRRGPGRQRHRRVLDHPIDIVNAEPDAFEVERRDGAPQRLGLFQQPRELIFLRRHAADDGQEVVEAVLGRLAVFGGHDRMIVAPDRVRCMETGRGRIQPPDLSEKGGARDGEPQRSDDRLFVQLLAFGDCADAQAVAAHVERAGVDGAVYEDVNYPRGLAILSLARTPELLVERVRPALNTGPCAGLRLKPEYTMLGRPYALGYEPDLQATLIDLPR